MGLGEIDLPAGDGVVIPGNDAEPATDPALIDTLRGINPWVDSPTSTTTATASSRRAQRRSTSRFVRMETIKKRTRATLPETGFALRARPRAEVDQGRQRAAGGLAAGTWSRGHRGGHGRAAPPAVVGTFYPGDPGQVARRRLGRLRRRAAGRRRARPRRARPPGFRADLLRRARAAGAAGGDPAGVLRARAIRAFDRRPGVDGRRTVVYGHSRGSESALRGRRAATRGSSTA